MTEEGKQQVVNKNSETCLSNMAVSQLYPDFERENDKGLQRMAGVVTLHPALSLRAASTKVMEGTPYHFACFLKFINGL